jgi:hypothetical protein
LDNINSTFRMTDEKSPEQIAELDEPLVEEEVEEQM